MRIFSSSRLDRLRSGWQSHRRRVIGIVALVLFFYLLGYFSSPVNAPKMCLIYG